MARTEWLIALIVGIAVTGVVHSAGMGRSGAPYANPITSFTFGTPWQYNASYPPKTVLGDGFGNTWADDDQIYVMHNDTSRWNDVATTANVMISTLSSTATDGSAVGTLVNGMTQWGTPMNTNTGSPARSHKVNSIISIGSMLYGLSWRLDPNWMSVPGTWDGQLIKSSDHGASWTPTPPTPGAPYSIPAMWPGTTFPFGWVQYGKAYTGTGRHGSNTYVYATIIVGASGAQIQLGRVPLATIANQNVADWQYWTHGDGMDPANWSSSLAAAGNVLDLPRVEAGLATGMQYLPRYDRYLYLATSGGGNDTGWYAYVCSAPWSCNQSPIATRHYTPQGYYMPAIMPKSLVNGGQQLVVATGGDSAQTGATGVYTLTYIPVTLGP